MALRPAFDTVRLDAGAGMTIESVALPGGAALRHEHPGDTLLVRLPRAAAFGDTVRFTVAYHARITGGNGLRFIQADGRPRRPQQVWSQGQEANNHHWFPTWDAPSDKLTWDMVVTVPRRFTVVSNGRLVADRPLPGGLHEVHWRQDRPASSYLVSLVVSPVVKVPDRSGALPVDYYVYPEDVPRARRLFGDTPDMLRVFARLLGTPYPWAGYAQTTVADHFGGMENVGATTLIDDVPDDTAYVDRPWYHRILIAHELAHQWFGDYVTTANWANMWLNEGFAEFLPCQYWEAKEGPAAEDDCFMDEYTSYLGLDGQRRMPLAAKGSNNVYPKGALVLRMLKQALGPERFWASVRHYLRRHAFGNATSDDLRQAILEATGQNLDWFFGQWVYGAGHPDLHVSAAWDSAAATVTVTVRQQQRDTLPADSTGLRHTVAEVFRLPVTIRVGTATGDVVVRDTLARREQAITVAGVTAPPTMVVFDADNAILKTLTFDQPTAWLATQLTRDSDLWNRWWVTTQLARRPTDSLAAAALAEALRGADWFLTRVHAAEALAQFPAPVAIPPLRAALADTAAAVRAAAIEALAAFDDPALPALARERFDRDPSYRVRAAALPLAVRDTATARALVVRALGTPSYQHVIRRAAIVAAAQSGDTTLVAPVDALIAADEWAALGLLAMGARGNTAALDRALDRLDDDRAWVRHWVVEAIRQVVPASLRPQLLGPLLPELRHEDTRKELEALLGARG